MSGAAILRLAKTFTEEQAEAIADVMDTQAATKADLLEVEHRLDEKITRLDGRVSLFAWMAGINITLTLLVLGKLLMLH